MRKVSGDDSSPRSEGRVVDRCFVIISGLPGSGKTTLARQLAPMLGLPLLDKDTILEGLFESRGTGDAAWRRKLSRESDRILQATAIASEGAILVSHWRLAGMRPNSGTPTGWLLSLPAKLVNVHCECPVEIAIERFVRRRRHPGHLDHERSHAEIVAATRGVAGLGRLNIGARVEVETSTEPDLEPVLREIRSAFAKAAQPR